VLPLTQCCDPDYERKKDKIAQRLGILTSYDEAASEVGQETRKVYYQNGYPTKGGCINTSVNGIELREGPSI